MAHYFIHCDGKIFLLEKNKELVLPSSKKEFEFEVKVLREFFVDGKKFLFCEPVLEKFPESWLFKQDALVLPEVSELVKKAIVFTAMPWIVGRAIVVDGKGQMVVLKGERGANKGKFTTPGGILTYAETSIETAIRESKEECNLDIEIVKNLGVKEFMNEKGAQYVIFFYLAKPISGTLKPNMDDIIEANWMPIGKALQEFDYYSFKYFKNWIKENPEEALYLTGYNLQ